MTARQRATFSPRSFAAGAAAAALVLGGGVVVGAGLPSAAAGKTGRINADLIDGFNGSQLALRRGTTGVYTSTTVEPFDADRDGDVDYVRAVATCPLGTRVTGGGFFNPLEYPIAQNVMYAPRRWEVWTTDLTADDAAGAAQVFAANATCYNPRGRVPSQPDAPEQRRPGRG